MRENLPWINNANNWAKFSMTAAIGVIHKGSLVRGLPLIKPYLPGGAAPSRFSEGGALFGLGICYAGKQSSAAEADLKAGLSEAMDPVVQHGAALGYGISAVASGSEGEYNVFATELLADEI
jgi:26S proteasome regulatory subunit N2